MLWFDTTSQQVDGQVPNIFTQLHRIVRHGHSMVIHNAINAVIIILKADPILYRTEITSKMKFAGWLNATQNDFFLIFRSAGKKLFVSDTTYFNLVKAR